LDVTHVGASVVLTSGGGAGVLTGFFNMSAVVGLFVGGCVGKVVGFGVGPSDFVGSAVG
jgi:hypothetical protein